MKLKAPLDEYTSVVADKPNLEFDLPGETGRINFHAFSDAGLTIQLVSPDGVVMPLSSGQEVGIEADYSRGWKLTVSVKKGSTVTHWSRLKPTKVFEFVDPTPLRISRQSNVSPSIPKAIREYVDLQLRKRGIDISADDLLEDVEDEDFAYEEGDDFDLDNAKYLDEESPVGGVEETPPPVPAAPAPGSPAPVDPPAPAPQPPAVPST